MYFVCDSTVTMDEKMYFLAQRETPNCRPCFRLKRPKPHSAERYIIASLSAESGTSRTRDIVQNSHVRKKFGGSHGDARKVDIPSSLGAYVLWWVTKIWNWILFNCTIDERITLSCDMCNVSLRRAAWFDIFMTPDDQNVSFGSWSRSGHRAQHNTG